jgi:diguanylate cyclase (GGDEF)-like protein
MGLRLGKKMASTALIRLTAAFMIVAGAAVAWAIVAMRQDAIANAQEETENIAVILAEQTERSIQAIDLVLRDIQERVVALTHPNDSEFNRKLSSDGMNFLMKERLQRLPQAEVVAIVSWDGRLLNTTRAWPAPVTDLRDRDYYKYFVHEGGTGLFVSSLVNNRVNGAPTVFFSRQLYDAEGQFAGLVLTGVGLSQFQQLYRSIDSVRSLSFSLIRQDGAVVVHHPDPENQVGKKIPSMPEWHKLVQEGGGNYRSPAYLDSHPRLVSTRPLPKYPLVVNVAYSEWAALATWRHRALSLSLGTCVILICALALLRTIGKQFALLRSAKQQLDAAVNNMNQGLCMFDAQKRLLVSNTQYADIYGLNAKCLSPGTPLQTILRWRVATGNAPEQAEAYINDRLREVSAGIPYSKLNELQDGRIISVTHQPLADGGWVALHQDVTEHKRAEQKIAHMALHDALTGLPNRTQLRDRIELSLPLAKRGSKMAIVCLDLDHFKHINDSLGHPVGDKLLEAVAMRLRTCIRDTDLVARLGGDEFAILQLGAIQPNGSLALAERLIESLSTPIDLDSHQVVIGTSIGIAVAPDDGQTPEELLKNADLALYRAKADGRNTFRFFEPAMNAKVQARRSLESDMRKALANEEFCLVYQPIVDTQTRRLIALEALLRWRHPIRGEVFPDEFIPIAEDTGLIMGIGDWVLEHACLEAAKWPADVAVAVNLSPLQFRNKALADTLRTAAERAAILASRIELEITEGVLLQSNPAITAALDELRGMGVRISMDDFGTGHSSLSYLQRFPFDKIKIDRAFVSGLPFDKQARSIVRAVATLAEDLGIVTVAEGVETEDQLKVLRSYGVTQAQGFYFSPPRDPDELRDLYGRLEGRAAA